MLIDCLCLFFLCFVSVSRMLVSVLSFVIMLMIGRLMWVVLLLCLLFMFISLVIVWIIVL